jgi:hypothetical protein
MVAASYNFYLLSYPKNLESFHSKTGRILDLISRAVAIYLLDFSRKVPDIFFGFSFNLDCMDGLS